MARAGYCVHNVEWNSMCIHCYFERQRLEEKNKYEQASNLLLVKENFIKLLKEDEDFLIEVKKILGVL